MKIHVSAIQITLECICGNEFTVEYNPPQTVECPKCHIQKYIEGRIQ